MFNKRKPIRLEDSKEKMVPVSELFKNPNPNDMFTFLTTYSNDLSCLKFSNEYKTNK